MTEKNQYLQLETEVVKALKTVIDPELKIDIYDLGMIYKVEVDDSNNLYIEMTFTAPNCPMAGDIVREVYQKTEAVEGINEVKVKLVFDPPWTKDMMSDEAKLEAGFL